MRFIFRLTIIFLLIGCSEPTANSKNKVSIAETNYHESADFVLPEFTYFCGQKINLTDEDIHEKIDREILINAYFQSATIQQIKRANRFFPVIEPILKQNGVPGDFKYLAVIESGLLQATSPSGALGFWQFMPQTAKEFGLEINAEIDERMHLEKSTQAACNYLKKAHDSLKDWVLTAAAYNRGLQGIKSDLHWQGTDNYFDTHLNSETARYVYRILAVKMIFENPERFGFRLKKMALYAPFKTRFIHVDYSIDNLAVWTKSVGINYKILVKLNPWILSNKLTVKNTSFKLKLPRNDFNLKPYQSY